MSPVYNDHQVVAALNSCLDLEKFNSLPRSVRDRLETLCRRHRLGMVCFMDIAGFGLKVYGDEPKVKTTSDECTMHDTIPFTTVDTDGHWMRCPGTAWSVEALKDWIVLDSRGKNVFKKWTEWDEEDEDENEEDFVRKPEWSPSSNHNSRDRAMKFTKAEAEAVAKEVNGVVVKY